MLETLPAGWEERAGEDGVVMFRNVESGRTSTEHPADASFRALLERERSSRKPYLSVQRAVFAEPMLHFRTDRSPEGALLRTEGKAACATTAGPCASHRSAHACWEGKAACATTAGTCASHRSAHACWEVVQSRRYTRVADGRCARWWWSAVLAASGQWLDFYDAYGKRYWYHLLSHEVGTDVEAIRAPACALTIQRIWRGYDTDAQAAES